ncbi:MAG: hypothetical protein DRP01_01335 [Archaeoglobales archaeon]|nr:MAG: hypothetical protein DRP01_01335 [Archaeoglobales archaeon]
MAKAPEINRVPPGRVKEVIAIAKSKDLRVFKKPHGRNVGAYLVGRAAPHKHSTLGETFDREKYSTRTWREEASDTEKKDLAYSRIDAAKKALEDAGFKAGAANLEKRLKNFVDTWVPDLRGATGYVFARYHGVPVLMPKVAFVVAQKGKDRDAWKKILEGDTRDQVIQEAINKGFISDLRRVLSPEELRVWLPPEVIAVL